MKQRLRILWCWIRKRHEPTVYLRESDQRVLITKCDCCGLLLKVVQLSKEQHREMLKTARGIGYRPPLLKA